MWEEKKLKEVVQVNPKVKLIKGENYPFIEIENIRPPNKFVSNKVSKKYSGQGCCKFINNDIVFSRITPCLENRKIAQVVLKEKECGFGSTEFYVFRHIKGKSDEKFIFYFVSSDLVVLPAINSMTGASGRQRADRKFIENLKISFPPLAIQQKIADVLSAYDDLIENNNRRIELLEQTAQQLFKEWFVRFRFPGFETINFTKGIPDGWGLKNFGEIAEIIDGDRGKNYPSQNELHEDGFCLFLNAGNVTSKGFDYIKGTFITEEKDSKLRKGKLNRGDIVITTRGTVGNVALYNNFVPFDDVRINSGMVIIRPIDSITNNSFLYLLLRSSTIQQLISLFSSGSAQPQLPIKDMKRMKVLIPSIEHLNKFEIIVRPILDNISIYMAKNQNLTKQRDLLIPRLMSGKIEV
jgi:type I restriction enzyme S subunit